MELDVNHNLELFLYVVYFYVVEILSRTYTHVLYRIIVIFVTNTI